jgi:hypothetical protein
MRPRCLETRGRAAGRTTQLRDGKVIEAWEIADIDALRARQLPAYVFDTPYLAAVSEPATVLALDCSCSGVAGTG